MQSYNPGTKIVVWGCHGGDSQRFNINNSNGEIRIYNNSLCLDGRNGDGRDLIISQCNGSATQKWYVNNLPTGDNVPRNIADSDRRRSAVAPGQIQNQGNSLCIDIKIREDRQQGNCDVAMQRRAQSIAAGIRCSAPPRLFP